MPCPIYAWSGSFRRTRLDLCRQWVETPARIDRLWFPRPEGRGNCKSAMLPGGRHVPTAQCGTSPHETDNGDVEGFGIVYVEAGVCGKPVIASRSGGVTDAVLDGQTGVLVEPGNVGALRNALKSLAEDMEMRMRFGAQGKEWAREHAPAVVAGRFEKVLQH